MRYLVTGVDTEVGKTVVGSALLRAATLKGLKSIGVKPVESGCTAGPYSAEDGVRLAAASGQSNPRTALLRLKSPVAPPLAAEQEGRTIDLDKLIDATRDLTQAHDFALIEGAGGLLSPITWSQTAIDIARKLKTRAIVVAADRLGVIGQVRLVVSVLEHAQIPVDAIVLNAIDAAEDDASIGTNLSSLKRLTGTPPVFAMPFCTGNEEAATAILPVLNCLMESAQS